MSSNTEENINPNANRNNNHQGKRKRGGEEERTGVDEEEEEEEVVEVESKGGHRNNARRKLPKKHNRKSNKSKRRVLKTSTIGMPCGDAEFTTTVGMGHYLHEAIGIGRGGRIAPGELMQFIRNSSIFNKDALEGGPFQLMSAELKNAINVGSINPEENGGNEGTGQRHDGRNEIHRTFDVLSLIRDNRNDNAALAETCINAAKFYFTKFVGGGSGGGSMLSSMPLQRLETQWRRMFSNGKTTTKAEVHSIYQSHMSKMDTIKKQLTECVQTIMNSHETRLQQADLACQPLFKAHNTLGVAQKCLSKHYTAYDALLHVSDIDLEEENMDLLTAADVEGGCRMSKNEWVGSTFKGVQESVFPPRDFNYVLSKIRSFGYKVKDEYVYREYTVLSTGATHHSSSSIQQRRQQQQNRRRNGGHGGSEEKTIRTGAYVLLADPTGRQQSMQEMRSVISRDEIKKRSRLEVFVASLWLQNSSDRTSTISEVTKQVLIMSQSEDSDIALRNDKFLYTGRKGYTLNFYACMVHPPGDEYIRSRSFKPSFVDFTFERLYEIFPTLNIIDWAKGNWWRKLMVDINNPYYQIVAYQLPQDDNTFPVNRCERVYTDVEGGKDLQALRYRDPHVNSREYRMCRKSPCAWSVVQELVLSESVMLIPRNLNNDGIHRIYFYVGKAGTGKSAHFDMIKSMLGNDKVTFCNAKGGSSNNSFQLARARSEDVVLVAFDEMDEKSQGLPLGDILLMGSNSDASVTNAKNGQIQQGKLDAYPLAMGNQYPIALTGDGKSSSDDRAESNSAIARRANGYESHRAVTEEAKRGVFSAASRVSTDTSSYTSGRLATVEEEEGDEESEESTSTSDDDSDVEENNSRLATDNNEGEEGGNTEITTDDGYSSSIDEYNCGSDSKGDGKSGPTTTRKTMGLGGKGGGKESSAALMDGDVVDVWKNDERFPAFTMMAFAISSFSFPVSFNFQSPIAGFKHRSRDSVAQSIQSGTRGGAFLHSGIYIKQNNSAIMPYVLLRRMFNDWARNSGRGGGGGAGHSSGGGSSSSGGGSGNGNGQLMWKDSIWEELVKASGCRLVRIDATAVAEIREAMQLHVEILELPKQKEDYYYDFYGKFGIKDASELAPLAGEDLQLLSSIKFPPIERSSIRIRKQNFNGAAAPSYDEEDEEEDFTRSPNRNTANRHNNKSRNNNNYEEFKFSDTSATANETVLFVAGLQPAWDKLKERRICELDDDFFCRVPTEKRHTLSTRNDAAFEMTRRVMEEGGAWSTATESGDRHCSYINAYQAGIITLPEYLNLLLMRYVVQHSQFSASNVPPEFTQNKKYDVLRQGIFANFKETFLMNSGYVSSRKWQTPVLKYQYTGKRGEVKTSVYDFVDPMKLQRTATSRGGAVDDSDIEPFFLVLEDKLKPFLVYDYTKEQYYARYSDSGSLQVPFTDANRKNNRQRSGRTRTLQEYYRRIYIKNKVQIHRIATALHLHARHRCLQHEQNLQAKHTSNAAWKRRGAVLKVRCARYLDMEKALRWERV